MTERSGQVEAGGCSRLARLRGNPWGRWRSLLASKGARPDPGAVGWGPGACPRPPGKGPLRHCLPGLRGCPREFSLKHEGQIIQGRVREYEADRQTYHIILHWPPTSSLTGVSEARVPATCRCTPNLAALPSSGYLREGNKRFRQYSTAMRLPASAGG